MESYKVYLINNLYSEFEKTLNKKGFRILDKNKIAPKRSTACLGEIINISGRFLEWLVVYTGTAVKQNDKDTSKLIKIAEEY